LDFINKEKITHFKNTTLPANPRNSNGLT